MLKNLSIENVDNSLDWQKYRDLCLNVAPVEKTEDSVEIGNHRKRSVEIMKNIFPIDYSHTIATIN